MVYLNYKTRREDDPRGKARAYFCAHPQDQAQWLTVLSEEILLLNDCAIYYAGPMVERTPDFMEALKDMNLFIMPVTKRLLTTDNYALKQEFAYAKRKHIPVLPIMLEPGLLPLFSKECGDMQFLDPNEQDATAISYREKLKKFLNETLLNDELIKKVRSAFEAYVFLSYRKQDRSFAQQLMRLIHKNDFCRDIAIWYDEFLTPGEDFNQSIQKALEESDLFVMTVTPQILEPAAGKDKQEDNYIVQKEYPMAKRAGKQILPVEMVKTDKAKLKQKFADMPNSTSGHDTQALAAALGNALRAIALRNPEKSPTHDFFIGLAYLKGIDVEVDHAKAVALIESAANAGVLQAADMMTSLYGSGTGVERSAEKMLVWQRRLLDMRRDAYVKEPSLENGLDLMMDLQALLEFTGELGNVQEKVTLTQELMQTAALVRTRTPDIEVERYWSAAACYLSQRLLDAGQAQQARGLCQNAEKILCEALRQSGVSVTNGRISAAGEVTPVQMILLRDYCTSLCTLADADLALYEQTKLVGYAVEAEDYFNQCYQYLTGEVMKDRYPYNREQRSVIVQRMGNLAKAKGKLTEAVKWYREAVTLDVERAKNAVRDEDFDAFDDLGCSLVTLALANPENVDVFSLMDAVDIWDCLSYLVPEFPMYKERYDELKPYLDQILARRKKDTLFTYEKNLHAVTYKVGNAIEPLRTLVQTRRELAERVRIFAETKKRADQQKRPEDLYYVAACYHQGEVTQKNVNEACRYAIAAADQKHVPALELAAELLKDKDPDAAKRYENTLKKIKEEQELKKWISDTVAKAKRGDAGACMELAEYCKKEAGGWFVSYETKKQFEEEQISWLEKAISYGHEPALSEAAEYYRAHGDKKKAKQYAKKLLRLKNYDGARIMRRLAKTRLGKWYWDKRRQHMRDQYYKRLRKQKR